MKTVKTVAVMLFAALLVWQTAAPAAAAGADKTTRYRVYQNSRLLKEFADKNEAIAYAKKWAFGYVEEIGTRKWIWSQFPKYQVSQLGQPGKWFFTLQEAIQHAQETPYSSVRNVQSIGWEWHNYPRYQVYQGEYTREEWKFATLEAAQKEAKRWANSNIIDLETNRWVWDSISPEKKEEYRQRDKVYKVYQGTYSRAEWEFAYLEDAVKEALRWQNSYIVNTAKDNKEVFSNRDNFTVYQYNTKLDTFVGLNAAIQYAKKWDHSRIEYQGQVIWNNYPYYIVYQGDIKLKEFNTPQAAQAYALTQPKAVVKTYYGGTVWDNSQGLKYWAWTGEMREEQVMNVVANTRGLDVISPTWFRLADASGNVEDRSSESLVRWLKAQGLEVHPLVNNQFNADMTTKFLQDDNAQRKFIDTVVNRSAALGVNGINLDFESMKGSDRDKFTQFVRKLAEAAHAKKLTVSIDLPRGSVSWNHLTAIDHAALAGIVDHIVIMAYDQYYSGSTEPGSVSGLGWAEQGIQEFLSYGIPRDKLIFGIPFYIRQWKLDAQGKLVGNNAIYTNAVSDLLAAVPFTKTWDERFGQYRIEYKKDGFTYVFWLEDEDTVKARIALAKKYSLAGVAAWRLGQEPASFWDTLAAEK